MARDCSRKFPAPNRCNVTGVRISHRIPDMIAVPAPDEFVEVLALRWGELFLLLLLPIFLSASRTMNPLEVPLLSFWLVKRNRRSLFPFRAG